MAERLIFSSWLTVLAGRAQPSTDGAPDRDRGLQQEAMRRFGNPECKRSEWAESKSIDRWSR